MKPKSNWSVVVAALGVIAVGIGLLAWWRLREAAAFAGPFQVRTYGGTNYVARLNEITVGKLNTGYVVIVTARLENPDPYPVLLKRDWFILMDHDKDYFQPVTNGTQTATIQLPASGALEQEMFSFTLPEKSLAGVVALEVGRNYWVMIKNEQPFTRRLKSGEFVSFRRREW